MIEEEIFKYSDELGPELISYFYDPSTELRGILVIDNTAKGPAIGGIRMLPDITTEEVFRLARAMTFKNAAAGIPHGGAKGGIIADHEDRNKYEIIRAYAKHLHPYTNYIPGPDMGTDESCMVIIYDEIGRAVGKPREQGGIPLDEIGSTGYGVAEAGEVAAEYADLDLEGATAGIEGFGAVGKASFRFLNEKCVEVIATSDSKGAIYNPGGLSYDELVKVKSETGAVKNYEEGDVLGREELLKLDVDILVPGARPDTITMENVDDVKAGLVLQGANIPITREAEERLHDRGILTVPDFVANAGGVIAGSVEVKGGNEEESFKIIKENVRRNTEETLELAREEDIYPREAAENIAKERIMRAMELRRLA